MYLVLLCCRRHRSQRGNCNLFMLLTSVSSRRRSETAGKEIPQCGSAAGHQSLSSWSPFSNIVVVVVVANSLSSHYDDFFSVCFVRDHPTGRTTAITGTLLCALCAAAGRFVFPALPAGSHRVVAMSSSPARIKYT